jgi:hypothetical protein
MWIEEAVEHQATIEIPDAAKIVLLRELGLLFAAINADDSHVASEALSRMRAAVTGDGLELDDDGTLRSD